MAAGVTIAGATVAFAQGADGAALMEAGIAAYRAGDYAQARDRFLQARAAGMDGHELQFNLALAEYKSGDDAAAQARFAALRRVPGFGPAAEYHLGLVAARQGRIGDAAEHLRTARAIADSDDMRELAATALERLGLPAPPRWSAAGTLAGGYDSNRDQSTELAPEIEPRSAAAFTELSGAARYLGEGARSEMGASLFLRDYTTDHDLDQQALRLHAGRQWSSAAWRLGTSVQTEAVWLGGAHFADAAGLEFGLGGPQPGTTWRLRYRPSYVLGADDFDYVTGWSHRLDLSYTLVRSAARWQFSLEGEANQRRDLTLGDEFFSQSPIRGAVGVQLTQRLSSRLALEASARYRRSRYGEANRMFVGSALVRQRRLDDLVQLGLGARLAIARGWSVRLDYRFSDNASSVARYDYRRHVGLLGLQWER